ncbi:hypothetical protein TTHERM_00977730 (macronuclear) [Tetrahymena thermophila SB210]|uniref:DIX domain-containing protein n=1 Tax=Tetrahymena thermophila (strain SB210) TaxID=312017 RepID=Q24GN7_TETTS|nr:hypothetical protein TTHERM_00977730 [Tetrahymena thermophila SB210]EAS06970.3 hypothetical protein TTHERM_00977730 [Tetrahymena thermophila SB210]|eukprot:XP_001027212.3 hypothetical protein TTHERM_00977730 [Tetrahymena thermophila SB210]
MAQKAFTMVFYIVPEDQDDIEQPNAFGIHKNQEDIKPSDIADSFPLPGEYIFRYRYKFQNNIVWMDINSNSNKIPLFNGKIYIKATRVSWTKDNNSQQPVQPQANVQTQVNRQSSSQNQQQQLYQAQQQPSYQQQQATQQKQVYQQQQQPKIPANQGYQQPDKQFSSQGTNGNQKSTNLLDDYEEKPTQKKANTAQLEANLLDMDDLGAGSSSSQKSNNKHDDDLWNF